MQAQNVKVWNDNDLPYKENFKGELVEIPAKKYIEMDWDTAVEFKGSFPNMINTKDAFNASGVQKNHSFKAIRIEGKPPHDQEEQPSEYPCHSCGDKFASEENLDSHIDKYHLDELDDEKVADKRKKTKKM